MNVTPDLTWLLGATLGAYVIGLYVLAFMVKGRIQTSEDFIVAGRRLGFPLCTATLVATWFGAGTILTATDEVRRGGLERAALEPFGAGTCLLVAGIFFARPLWEMKLLTVSDFFLRKFDRRAELLSAAIMVPSYFGWIAAQLVALAGVLELFFGVPMGPGILVVAVVATGYTLLGGMWSVTLTDAIQLAIVFLGLLALAVSILGTLGGGSFWGGLSRLWMETPAEMRRPIPIESLPRFFGWISVFAVGALGNVPGQDLMQRVFSARSSKVARRACCWGGALYIGFGLIPITLGLAARILFPEDLERAVLPALAQSFLQPLPAVIFTVVLVSAVLSTIDSAILSPASVLSQNVMEYWNRGRISTLQLNRLAVLVVAGASIGFAFAGESAYSLLEDAYELPLVGLFIPLTMGLYRGKPAALPAIVSMLVGSGLWALHYLLDWTTFFEPLGLPLPSALSMTAASLLAYLATDAISPKTEAT